MATTLALATASDENFFDSSGTAQLGCSEMRAVQRVRGWSVLNQAVYKSNLTNCVSRFRGHTFSQYSTGLLQHCCVQAMCELFSTEHVTISSDQCPSNHSVKNFHEYQLSFKKCPIFSEMISKFTFQ